MELDPPRWPGGPPICPKANLPHFETRKEMRAFQELLCSSALLDWFCPDCAGFHYWGKTPAPAGTSSGSSRPETIPKRILELAQSRYE